MNYEHFYVYSYGRLQEESVPLDTIARMATYQPDHIILLKHYDQLDEIRGMSLMYGVELKVDTFANWMECNRFRKTTGSLPKRLPGLVISNYHLPNITGI